MLLSKITAPIGGIGGALLGAGIGLADDAVFALLDGTSGYKEWGEVGLEFGKKVAMAGVGVATGGMFNGFGAGTMGLEGKMFESTGGLMGKLPTKGIGSVIGKTMFTGMQQVTNTFANSAINAITWDAENGLGFSHEAMSAGMQSGMVGALSSMTSVFTGGMLSHFNATEKLMAGFSSANIGDVQRFNSFAGSMAGAGVTYAMTGNASFNILNASDLTGGRLQGGLFEMHVGKDGFSGRIGMGGTDLSLGTIAGALRGASVLGVNGAIGLYGMVNNVDAAVALRVQYGFGDGAQQGQLASILLGGTELELGGGANGEEAQTTTQNGRRVVHLAGYREGMSVEEQMRLAITLGHEAYRDGQFNGVAGQDQETTQAVMGHTAMMLRMGSDQRYAKMVTNMVNDDVGLQRDYEAYMNYANGGSADDYASYVAGNYDSSADYWRLVETADGYGFEWDGEHTFDLSILGVEGRQAQVGQDHLGLMWQNMQANPGAGMTLAGLTAGVTSFNSLSTAALNALALMNLDDPNNALVGNDQSLINPALDTMRNAMLAAQNSGMLQRTAASIANGRMVADRPGITRLFRGDAHMTGNYGGGIRVWANPETIRWHDSWDMRPTNGGSGDFIANEGGSLGLEFSEAAGLGLKFQNETNTALLEYWHSASSSIDTYMGLFASEGVEFNGARLNGIARNMVIGSMGNTGTATTGAHVHLKYLTPNERGRFIPANPAGYFGANFPVASSWDVPFISGYNQTAGSHPDLRLGTNDMFKAFLYSQSSAANGVAADQQLNYQRFVSNNRDTDQLSEVNWVELQRMIRMYERMR